ncbi:MAG: hypothetical protein ACM3N6_11815 [Betaproteobacteria bacterium]|jgi:hypothetical protein
MVARVGVRRAVALAAGLLALATTATSQEADRFDSARKVATSVPPKPAVAERLRALYPDDRATGCRLGDIRGAMTLRQPR